MDIRIIPGALRGRVCAAPSKSMAHRLLILAALSASGCQIDMPALSEDVAATICGLRALGADISVRDGAVFVAPIAGPPGAAIIDCAESGSTLRFLLPVAASLGCAARFSGRGRLPERPIAGLIAAMAAHGVSFDADRLPFAVRGRLCPGEYAIPGNVSSQYTTGLLLVLPILHGDSRLRVVGRQESAEYVGMTLSALRMFGATVRRVEDGFVVPGGQRYIAPERLRVEGDWSNAAPFLAMGAVGGSVSVTGLDTGSAQGDKAVVEILRRFGAIVSCDPGDVTVAAGCLTGQDIDVSDIPDLMPSLCAVAACACGVTRITGGARLRIKESDRISAMAAALCALGVSVGETSDGCVIRGGTIRGGTVDCRGDHRVAMAAAVLASRADGPVTLIGADAVAKSYPAFFTEYQALGGVVDGM